MTMRRSMVVSVIAFHAIAVIAVGQTANMPNSSEEQRPAHTVLVSTPATPALEKYAAGPLTDLWKRPGLSPRDRSIVTVSALIARNQTNEMPRYFNLALDNGVLPRELSEIITHLAFYSGWANATAAAEVAKVVFAERGIGSDQLPVASPQLLPVNQDAEARRAASVEQQFGKTAPGLVASTTDVLFRDLWLRPGLAPRDRCLVTVSALIASGQVAQVAFHLNKAMDNGLSAGEAGEVVSHLTGHPNYGLPWGQDRLVPLFLATLANRQRSRRITFASAAEMLDTFGMQQGGSQYRRLVGAFQRIFGATIFFGTDTHRSMSPVVHEARFHFMSEARIWYSRDPGQQSLPGDCQNLIVLTEEFYQEVTEHPIPTDLEAAKALSSSPAALDLFTWLSYRCFVARGEERISLFGEFGLANQLGCVNYRRPRRFRERLEQWLALVHVMWPECPARICPDGYYLMVDQANALSPGRRDACA